MPYNQEPASQVRAFLSALLVDANGHRLADITEDTLAVGEAADRMFLNTVKLYPNGMFDLGFTTFSTFISPASVFTGNVFVDGRMSLTTNSTANVVTLIGDSFDIGADTTLRANLVIQDQNAGQKGTLSFAPANGAADVHLFRNYGDATNNIGGELQLSALPGGLLSFHALGNPWQSLIFLNDTGGIAFSDGSVSPLQDTGLSRVSAGILGVSAGPDVGYGAANGGIAVKHVFFANTQSDITSVLSETQGAITVSAVGENPRIVFGTDELGIGLGDALNPVDTILSRVSNNVFGMGIGYGDVSGSLILTTLSALGTVSAVGLSGLTANIGSLTVNVLTVNNTVAALSVNALTANTLTVNTLSVTSVVNTLNVNTLTMNTATANTLVVNNTVSANIFSAQTHINIGTALVNNAVGSRFTANAWVITEFKSGAPGNNILRLVGNSSGFHVTGNNFWFPRLTAPVLEATGSVVTPFIFGTDAGFTANVTALNLYASNNIFTDGEVGGNTAQIITTSYLGGDVTAASNVDIFGTLNARKSASFGTRKPVSNNVAFLADCDGFVHAFIDGATVAAQGTLLANVAGTIEARATFTNQAVSICLPIRAGETFTITANVTSGTGTFRARFVPQGLNGNIS
jgi:hypothetical protein